MADSKFESLTTGEAASILRTSPNTVRQMLQTGTLHGYKVGTRSNKATWRVTKAELERFMTESVTANA